MVSSNAGNYPLTFDIEYPEAGSNRITALFRLLLLIPCLIMDMLLAGPNWLSVALIILVRRKYPRWLFDYNVERIRYSARVHAYSSLLMDSYPSTDDSQGISIECEYPDASQLNRILPLIKWILAIPHFLIIVVFWVVEIIVFLAAWLAILITAKYPRTLFNLSAGMMRWNLRVGAYTTLLITDRYPPFRLT